MNDIFDTPRNASTMINPNPAFLGTMAQELASRAARYEAEVLAISKMINIPVNDFKLRFEAWIKTQVIGTFDGLRYCSRRARSGQTFPWEWRE